MDMININDLTRVQSVDGIFLKREDEFNICGVCGGKARAAYQIIHNGLESGYKTFCTAGSRMSPQCEIVSYICEHFNVNCHLFMPNGKSTSVINNISKNKTSVLHRTKVGYNSVLIHDALTFANANKCCYIPFGMECMDNIEVTKHQVKNIPKQVKRIIIPCGSGMSMISVIKGLDYYCFNDIEVVGVIVGKSPKQNFDKFIKHDLFSKCVIKYSFVFSDLKYETPSIKNVYCGIKLDPIYEAKCIPFIRKGDLLWIVGHRREL